MSAEIRGDFDTKNRLILALRPDAISFLEERAIVRRLTQGQTLYQEGAGVTHAIFPHEGVVSMMAEMQNGRRVEKVSVGNEGFVGICCVLGGGDAISTDIVQVEGYASWISIKDLDEAYAAYPCVGFTLLHYAKTLTVQLMESIACNALHGAEQRVCRWLLSAHDRVNSDSFRLTQQAVSEVLGLRRATVSTICKALMDRGALEYSRGLVTITDRRLLEETACECYCRIKKAFVVGGTTGIASSSVKRVKTPIICE
ncbi:MAG: Crp/Fnr family transcriptional regulator [Hoeflea sp.]|uniref:Crp/Fnr family transcriptional regulator n=1 Tax=Hoeflea sp. TaxID=1940281 RepID=UPI0027320460|nr:Crp/Fnr family transcriptional regulator [Hoeflea sp.]MDP2119740.1 Crp/Fnr family transcriptional regulator [Hoeflea sp.]